jgi:hypothetical protein
MIFLPNMPPRNQFRRLKKARRGRPKGSIFLVRGIGASATVKELARAPISWKKRPLYYMDGKEVHKGSLQNGEVVEGPAVNVKGDMRRGYNTPSQTAMELTPSKAAQRTELANKISGGTVLELQAGKGNLSKQVYAPVADKIVMVDKSQQSLNKADAKLAGKVPHETIAANNVEWLKEEVDPSQFRNLRLVDFDPFGSPADAMKAFFRNFPIEKRLIIGVTDGSKTYLGYKQGGEGRKWLKETYGIDLDSSGTREEQIKVLDTFMQTLGRKYGFNVKPINAGFGKQTAVYAGYEIAPK